MTTRSATFNTKIKSLKDLHHRVSAGSGAQPSGLDIATTLKYFSHTLNSMTRDVSNDVLDQLLSPGAQIRKLRYTIFPDLDYNGVYSVQSLADDIPLVNIGALDFAEAYLNTICALLIFLDPDKRPASRRAICTLQHDDRGFEYTNDQELHLLLVETLMKANQDITQDLFMVIGYASVRAKVYGVRILFYLFPGLVPVGEEGYAPAQNDFAETNGQVPLLGEMVEEEGFLGTSATEDDSLVRSEFQKRRQNMPALRMFNLGRLKRSTAARCENPRCASTKKVVYCICCSWECGKLNTCRPFRQCKECYQMFHQSTASKQHRRQCYIILIENKLLFMQYMIDSIIKMLKNCGTAVDKLPSTGVSYRLPASVIEEDNSWTLDFPLEDLKAYTIYGVWLLREMLALNLPMPDHYLRYLVDACLKWLHATSTIRDDHLSRRLEHLKQRYVCPWIKKLSAEEPEVVVACLAKQAGIDTAALLPSQVNDVYESLNILLCLASYDIVDIRVWVSVMPVWLKNLKSTEDPKTDTKGFSKLLLKLLDTEMSLMPFSLEETYSFIFTRLGSGNISQAYKALVWLQVLCNYKIIVPIRMLFDHFQQAVDALVLENTLRPKRRPDITPVNAGRARAASVISDEPAPNSMEAETTLPCFVVMLDILCHQLEAAQNFAEVSWEYLRVRTFLLLTRMIASPWHAKLGEDTKPEDLKTFSQTTDTYYPALWFKLSYDLLGKIFALRSIHGSDMEAGVCSSSQQNTDFSPHGTTRTRSAADVRSVRSEFSSGSELKHQSSRASDVTRLNEPYVSVKEQHPVEQIVHAHEEQASMMMEETMSFDLTASEKIAPVMVRAVTLTDEDTGMAACTAAEPKSIDDGSGRGSWFAADDFGFWHTTQGKFKFLLSELPYELQLLYGLSKLIGMYDDQTILCDIVRSIKLICLEGHALTNSVKEARGFLIWAQENLLIPVYWNIIGHERDNLAFELLPLIAHCAALSPGSEVFWNILDDSFLNDSWTVRFGAVTKTSILFRFLDSQNELLNGLHSVVANGFCHLIASMFDEEAMVAESAGIWLKCLKKSSIEFLMKCMQTHYGLVIDDRPTVLQRILQLSNSLSTEDTFSWQFFYDCFDNLCLEAEMELHDLGFTLDDSRSRATMTPEARRERVTQVRRAMQRSKDMKAIVVRGKLTNPNHRALLTSPNVIGETTPNIELNYLSTPEISTPLEVITAKKPRTGVNTAFPADHWKDFTEEETSYPSRIFKAVNGLGGSTLDRVPLYALINAFMKFLARSQKPLDADSPELELRRQTFLRFNYFLGYHSEGNNFTVLVKDLKTSTSFISFLFSLPEVMDNSAKFGNTIMNIAMSLLGYCTSSQTEVAFNNRVLVSGRNLAYLPPHCRLPWMKSLFIFLFKYGSEDMLEMQSIQRLVILCINSVRSLGHSCTFETGQPHGLLSKKSSFVSEIDGKDSIWRQGADDMKDDDHTPPKDLRGGHRERSGHGTVPLISEPSTESRTDGNDLRRHPLSFDSQDSSQSADSQRLPPREGGMKTPFTPADSKDTPDMSVAHSLAEKLSAAVRNAPPPDLVYREIVQHGPQKAIGTDETPRDPNEPYSNIHSDCIEQTSQSKSAFKDKQKMVSQTQEVDPEGNAVESSTTVTILENDVVQIQTCRKWTKQSTATYVTKHIGPLYESPLGTSYSQSTPAPEGGQKAAETSSKTRRSSRANAHQLGNGQSNQSDKGDSIKVGEAKVVKAKEPLPDFALRNPKTYQSRSYPVTRPRKLICTPLTKDDRYKFRRPLSAILSEETDDSDSQQPIQEPLTPRRRDAMSHIFPPAVKQHAATEVVHESDKARVIPPLPSHNTLFNRKCPNCGETVHNLREDDVSWSILCLEALIRRHPGVATPLLLDILDAVVCATTQIRYSWQNFNYSVITPGNLMTIIRQFVRVLAIQLGPSRLFPVLFLSKLPGSMLLEIVALSLADCEEFNSLVPLQHCLDTCYSAKEFPSPNSTQIIVANICVYMESLPVDVPLSGWANILDHFDKFLRRLPDGYTNCSRVLTKLFHYLMRIVRTVSVTPNSQYNKNIMEPIGRLFRQNLRSSHSLSLIDIKELCGLCYKAHRAERDKLQLAKAVAETLVDAIKIRRPMPEINLLTLVQCTTQDLTDGESHFSPHDFDNIFQVTKKLDLIQRLRDLLAEDSVFCPPELQISQCLRENVMDVMEFLSDLHGIHNLRQPELTQGFMFTDDTLGGSIKAGLAQFASFEIIRESYRDAKALHKFFPWLQSSTANIQQGTKDFEDCVVHIRLLSWLLLGSLKTMVSIPPSTNPEDDQMSFQLFPFTAYSNIADRILLILSCFAEHSQSPQNSLERMCSLSHAFTLCQLWTVYCELSAALFHPEADNVSEEATTPTSSLMSFWTKVTPAVLQLVSHSKNLAEIVGINFLAMMEALKECNSQLLNKLLPMWVGVLLPPESQLPLAVKMRFRSLETIQAVGGLPTSPTIGSAHDYLRSREPLQKWLLRLQFKVSQIEKQSSHALRFIPL